MRFLEGPAGAGKTTQAVAQMRSWLDDGVNPREILVLVPQRTLGRPYQTALAEMDHPNAFDVQVVTFNGLAQRAVTLYWSLIAERAIPNWDGRDPTYLTIETAQYYMAEFVQPVIDAGFFDSLSIDRPRLIAQILNNLSAAAVNGFPLDEIPQRLTAAWGGHSSRLLVYKTAGDVAKQFRQHCLDNVLLDFSLQIEIFTKILFTEPTYQEHMRANHRYLILDNAEENFPVTLDFVNGLWDSLDDGLIVYDQDAGYRVFLGASPNEAYFFYSASDQTDRADAIHAQQPQVTQLAHSIADIVDRRRLPPEPEFDPMAAFEIGYENFYPQMIDWVADRVIDLIENGVSPREIVILAPFLGDALRFTLFNRFDNAGVPYVSHRPSRAIRDEPAARAILTLMKLTYEGWEVPPPRQDISQMLVHFIDDLDPIRAELLANVIYRPGKPLGSFDQINNEMQGRITYLAGERYELLRGWLLEAQDENYIIPPDHFIRRLFDFVSQPGFRFHADTDAGRIVAEMIESAVHFRRAVASDGLERWDKLAIQYISLVGDGVLAEYHYTSWHDENKDAVFIAPAYTFLMRNRFVDYQFWVDVGSNAWFERLEQPVTHPYVLRRDYQDGTVWTDEQEVAAQNDLMRRLLLGLIHRCRQQVFLGFADLGEQGYEQRGPLLRIFNRILGVYGQH
jgi:hypothetical protein